MPSAATRRTSGSAAVWKDRIFLYQAWRNPRARMGRDLFDIGGKVRAIDVQRSEAAASEVRIRATIAEAADVEALVSLIVRAPVRRPSPHGAGEPRYWLTFWLIDGTTLSRPYFPSRANCWAAWYRPPSSRPCRAPFPGVTTRAGAHRRSGSVNLNVEPAPELALHPDLSAVELDEFP